MKLIGSLSSPYVRKVRIVLAEKKLDCPLVLDNVWSADTQIQATNPLGKVPCLVMDDGNSLFDSRVIVEYLDTLSPVSRLVPAAGRERLDVKWWEALADGVLDACVLMRAEETQRAPEQRNADWVARQRGKVEAALPVMEATLGERAFCVGHVTSNYSLADIAVGCALGYLDFRFPDIAWREPYPNLARLYTKLAQRPSFIDTQPG
ncbi:glutathione S-transferase [Verticiella sediminum]|uniref:Glutathione S-transferase n=1 Tax=Verticiella sediminum TaxID=1247510 RepID=A0A556A966_9BURK|nr:glutathione S-transferase N-terminal domain-containing protein [Verticiella sediminum]TSH89437.1 glutathione S-transferase [Verticiella sediminum]